MNKVVILAAGKGTRMKSDLPKVLVSLKGKPMIEYLVASVIKSGVDSRPIIVASPDNRDLIKQALKNYHCQYVIQKKQLGTGHALACASGDLNKQTDKIICFYGDHPFVRAETIKHLADNSRGEITMTTVKLDDFDDWRKNFFHWGRIIRNGTRIKEIVEFKDADDETKQIKEVNPGFYRFNSGWLKQNIGDLKNNNAQREYYLTDLIKIACQQNQPIADITVDAREAVGINSKEELDVAERLIHN